MSRILDELYSPCLKFFAVAPHLIESDHSGILEGDHHAGRTFGIDRCNNDRLDRRVGSFARLIVAPLVMFS